MSHTNWTNHFSSLALIVAAAALPFEQTLSRIAPWLIPHAVALRGGDPADVELAVEVLDGVLSLEGRSAPDLGSDVTIYEAARTSDPEAFTLTIREEEQGSPMANLRAAVDEKRRSETRSRAVPIALERILKARTDGALLFMHNFASSDLEPIIRYAPSALARWMEGVDVPTPDFMRRVRLAEGFYLALCEALLVVSPLDGARLWRSLRAVLHTNFIGEGGVSKLAFMLNQVSSTPDALRRELLDITLAHTDGSLFEVALAARLAGNTAWLETCIQEDEASGETWRIQRGRILQGFLGVGKTAADDASLDESSESLRENRERKAGRWRQRELWARHWWGRYWASDTDEEAYAAWLLLVQSVDRRAHVWLKVPVGIEDRHPRRVAHFRFNHHELVRAMEKAEKKLHNDFLGRSTFEGVSPWLPRPD